MLLGSQNLLDRFSGSSYLNSAAILFRHCATGSWWETGNSQLVGLLAKTTGRLEVHASSGSLDNWRIHISCAFFFNAQGQHSRKAAQATPTWHHWHSPHDSRQEPSAIIKKVAIDAKSTVHLTNSEIRSNAACTILDHVSSY